MNLGQLWGKQPPRPQVSRQQALQVYPVRNPSLVWEQNEAGLVKATLVARRDLWGRALAGLFSTPESRQVELDEVGSFVWNLCDGEHTMNDIVQAMMEKHKLGRREVEASLNEFMRMLAKRGMITIAVPKSVVAEMDPAVAKSLGLTEVEVLKEQPPAEEEGT